jgi:predicted dehydrogenase
VGAARVTESSVRWGILGTGTIAGVFAATVPHTDGGRVVAVGSRTTESATRFATEFGIERACGSYDELVELADVDAVYIATPHAQHADAVRRCLDAGKHVLCEKPMTVSAADTASLAELARLHERFLMEALWSRFLPAYRTLRSLLEHDEIGDVVAVDASLGYRFPFDPSHRLFAPELGGGALLDLGIYPVHLAHFVLGVPTSVRAIGRVGSTGVDEHAAVTMNFADSTIAVATCAIRSDLACTGRVTGTTGAIEIPSPMHCPQHLDIISPGVEPRRIETPPGEHPFRFEIDEVQRCLRAGLTESPVMPLTDSIAIATTLDLALAEVTCE